MADRDLSVSMDQVKNLYEKLGKMTENLPRLVASCEQSSSNNALELSNLLQEFNKSNEDIKLAIEKLTKTTQAIDSKLQQILDEKTKGSSTGIRTVKLNVGGRYFEIAEESLLKHENTYFSALLSSDVWKPREDGAYFLDADPHVFEYIIAYFRYDEIYFDDMPPGMAYRVLMLMDYLSISIAAWLQPDPVGLNTKQNVILSDANQCFELPNESGIAARLCGQYPCIKYSVKLLALNAFEPSHLSYDGNYDTEYLIIGFCPKSNIIGWGGRFESDLLQIGDVITVFYSKQSTIQYLLNGEEFHPKGFSVPNSLAWNSGLLYPMIKSNLPGLKMAFVT